METQRGQAGLRSRQTHPALLSGAGCGCMVKMEGEATSGLGTSRGDEREESRCGRKPRQKEAGGDVQVGVGETEMA